MIKVSLDSWYLMNIFNKGFGSQVADNLFCNDRQLESEVGGGRGGPGYGTGQTYYAAYHRLYTNKTPTLKCGLQNDQFTTSVDGEVGNGALTYPVGLLTADEASMAGLTTVSNTTNYLYTNRTWWLFSPRQLNGTIATGSVWFVSASGFMSSISLYIDTLGARPSVSLISTTRVTGTGSAADPFIAI